MPLTQKWYKDALISVLAASGAGKTWLLSRTVISLYPLFKRWYAVDIPKQPAPTINILLPVLRSIGLSDHIWILFIGGVLWLTEFCPARGLGSRWLRFPFSSWIRKIENRGCRKRFIAGEINTDKFCRKTQDVKVSGANGGVWTAVYVCDSPGKAINEV